MPCLSILKLFRVLGRGWRLSKKGKKSWLFGTQPQKTQPGLDGPNASGWLSTGNSARRFRRYRWSTLVNYDSNLWMCFTSLIKLISPENNWRDSRIIVKYKGDLWFEFEYSYFKHLVISHFNIDFWYQKSCTILFFFAQPPSPRPWDGPVTYGFSLW